MRDSKTEETGRRRMQFLQKEYETNKQTICVVHVANKNNNNREINAAKKTGLRKCS